jgi:hypothetical protein
MVSEIAKKTTCAVWTASRCTQPTSKLVVSTPDVHSAWWAPCDDDDEPCADDEP